MLEVFFQYDIFLVAAVLGVTLLYLYTIGKDYTVTICLALYMALATILFVPFLNELSFSLGGAPEWLTRVAMLLLLVVVFAYLQIHNGYFEPYVVPSRWEVPVFALIFTGMFVSASVSFFPPETVEGLSDLMRLLFVEEPVADVWFLGMPLALLFIKGEA